MKSLIQYMEQILAFLIIFHLEEISLSFATFELFKNGGHL